MIDAPSEPIPTKAWPASHPCAFAALSCSFMAVLTAGLLWFGCAEQRRRRDEQFAVAIRRVLDPAPLEFDPADGVAPVLSPHGLQPCFEVSRDDQAEVLAVLAPLGEVKSVTLLSIGVPSPIDPLPVRCHLEGTRTARDVTFVFKARDLPMAVWWRLRSAELE